MEDLSPAEQHLIREHREKVRKEINEAASVLEGHGYGVIPPRLGESSDIAVISLTNNQISLLKILRDVKGTSGSTLTDLRDKYCELTNETMTSGGAWASLQALVGMGRARQEGYLYYAV